MDYIALLDPRYNVSLGLQWSGIQASGEVPAQNIIRQRSRNLAKEAFLSRRSSVEICVEFLLSQIANCWDGDTEIEPADEGRHWRGCRGFSVAHALSAVAWSRA